MATATATPNTKKASKLLDRYAELNEQHLQLKDAFTQSAAPLLAEMLELKTKLEDWSNDEANAAAFGKKKSINLDGGTFGFKLGTKAIAFPLDAPEDIKEKYLAVVKKELPTAVVLGVDSKKVVGGWEHFPKLAKALEKLGINVKQEESFYITPKK